VRRYPTKAEAVAALEQIEAEEKVANKPWRGCRGDYEVRRFHIGDYMSEQDYRMFGSQFDMMVWA
jgi:hypothetical protein